MTVSFAPAPLRGMRATRRRALVAIGSLGGGAACIAAAFALAGCPNTASTSLYTPPTGIQIDAQNLVAGIGCGTGPGQVYRYAAVVWQVLPSDAGSAGGPDAGPLLAKPAITSGVFDCFSDALFANLPSPDGGATQFQVNVYAYTRTAFPSELSGCENLPLNVACPGDDASVVARYESQATWQTTCWATQSQGVPQVAVCGELFAPAEGGIEGDGGDAAVPSDAADAGDASDAGQTADAPSDAPTAEASDGGVVSGEGGDASLE